MPEKLTHLEWLLRRVPKFMHPDYDLIKNISDLAYQVDLEIDLAESGSLDPRWNHSKFRRAYKFQLLLAAINKPEHPKDSQ